MSWKDILEKFNLADIKSSIKLGQGGFFNFKTVNNYYTITYSDPSSIDALKSSAVTPNYETIVKQEALKRLNNKDLVKLLNMSSGSTQAEIVDLTATSTALDYAKNRYWYLTEDGSTYEVFYFPEDNIAKVYSPLIPGTVGAGKETEITNISSKADLDKKLQELFGPIKSTSFSNSIWAATSVGE